MARNCLAYMLDFIVMQMSKVNREKCYCSELWNLFSWVPTGDCFWCYSRQRFTSLAFIKCRKECNILKVILVKGTCPLKTEIARFPIGFRLNLFPTYRCLLILDKAFIMLKVIECRPLKVWGLVRPPPPPKKKKKKNFFFFFFNFFFFFFFK